MHPIAHRFASQRPSGAHCRAPVSGSNCSSLPTRMPAPHARAHRKSIGDSRHAGALFAARYSGRRHSLPKTHPTPARAPAVRYMERGPHQISENHPQQEEPMSTPATVHQEIASLWNARDFDGMRNMMHGAYTYTGGDGKEMQGP